jgi:hypothetical protein
MALKTDIDDFFFSDTVPMKPPGENAKRQPAYSRLAFDDAFVLD